MTSAGGGAVAFPVMTIAFSIEPYVARDFSLMIQSFGMSCAAFTIFFMRVRLEWATLIICSLGGILGVITGLHTIDPYLKPAEKKMIFVSVWFAFAFVLFLLNRKRERKTMDKIPNLNWWRVLVLIATGVLGGIFTSVTGSGLDLTCFSIITTLFRVSEKIATPTSVVLMAGNTIAGFYWRQVMMDGVAPDGWQFLAVCLPIVVIGAPIGSLIGTHFHRLVLAGLLYVINTAALIGAFVLVPQTVKLVIMSVCILVGGCGLFYILTVLGAKIMDRLSDTEREENATSHGPEFVKTNGIKYKEKQEETVITDKSTLV